MKKWIAALLAMLLVISLLAGCSSKKEDDEEDDDKESSQSSKDKNDKDDDDYYGDNNSNNEVSVGTMLQRPEKLFDRSKVNNIYLSIRYVDDEAVDVTVGIQGMQSENMIIRYAESTSDAHYEYIAEINANGTYAVYTRNAPNDKFTLDADADSYQVESIKNHANNAITMVDSAMVEESDIKLRKITATKSDEYAYTVIESGETIGTLCVDKETGLITSISGEDIVTLTLLGYNLDTALIPSYN